MIKRVVNDEITIEDAYKLFNSEKIASGVSKVGERIYWKEIKQFLDTVDIREGDYVSLITSQDVTNWVIKMRESSLALASINHNIRCCRVFIYWCAKNDYLKKFKISLVKGQEEKIKFYSNTEIEKLLKKPSKEDSFVDWRNYAITCFVLSTGARASTLINVKNTDIDWKSREIVFSHLKNKQVASVPLSGALEKVLREFLSLWKRSEDEFYLFPEVNEEALNINALGHSFAKYCEKRGVQRKGVHALRHTFARGWIKLGGNAFTLQHMLTHSDLTMTKKYVRLFADDLKEGFESYSPLDNCLKTNARTIKRYE